MEQWKAIPDFNGLYDVSDRGRIRAGETARFPGRVLKLHLRSSYLYVALHKNGRARSFDVHRLVADAFVPGRTAERNEVNHKNLKKTDNRACNLEWVSHAENVRHAFRSGGVPNHISRITKKPVLCKELGRSFGSSYAAAEFLNTQLYGGKRDVPTMARNIRWCVRGNRQSAYNFHWSEVNMGPSTTIPKGSTGECPEMGGPS